MQNKSNFTYEGFLEKRLKNIYNNHIYNKIKRLKLTTHHRSHSLATYMLKLVYNILNSMNSLSIAYSSN